jgi:hypothetical protein
MTLVASTLVLAVAGEGYATPFPQPAKWAHAEGSGVPVTLSKNITVMLLHTTPTTGEGGAADAISAEDPLVATIIGRYQQLLRNKVSWSGASGSPSSSSSYAAARELTDVSVKITGDGDSALILGPDTDESYAIKVSVDGDGAPCATITAASVFGLRHGLETFAQLVITPSGTIGGISASAPLTVTDVPAFAYRGLMIDTGRHFLNLDTIKRAIEGMATLKLNVLHWHILDSSSFPVQSLKFPLLSAKGAYASQAVYSLDDLRAVVAFARSRGVRVVVEIEMPGHGSFSAGMPQLSLSSCGDVLDPTKDATYDFLGTFLAEMATVFDDPLMYLGGDEVGFDPKCKWPGSRVCGYHCFDKDPSVAAWMQAKGMNATQLLDHFWSQVTARVVPKLGAGKTVGVWMADRPNGAGGPSHVWPAPHMATLPRGAVANVYQSMRTAGPILDAGYPRHGRCCNLDAPYYISYIIRGV